MPDPDTFLVKRMLRGDEAAYEEFFDAHFAPLFRFALPRVGGNAEVAEEVVQEAMCRAMRKLATWRGEASLLTWLCTFCRHEISDYYARERKAPPMTDLMEDLPEIRAAIDSAIDSLRATNPVRQDTARLVQLVLDRLPGRYGDVLEWKYLDGRSVAEIGERLGVGTKAAESLLTRARVAFRDAFTAVYGGRWHGAEV